MRKSFFQSARALFWRPHTAKVDEKKIQEAIQRFSLAPPLLTAEERTKLKEEAAKREELLKTAVPVRPFTREEKQALYDGLVKHQQDKARGYIY